MSRFENGRQPEGEPEKETIEGIRMAETIARARMELEQQVIFSGDVPPAQWEEATQAYLDTHPELQEYQRVFIDATRKARRANEKVEKLWRRVVGKGKAGEGAEPNTSKLIEVQGRKARKLYTLRFGKLPKGDLVAGKGRVAIYFETPTPATETSHVGQRGAGGIAFASAGEYPPAILMGSRDAYDGSAQPWGEYSLEVMTHEVAHVKHGLIRDAKVQLGRRLMDGALEMPALLAARLVREARKGDLQSTDSVVKGELLAYLTRGSMFDAQLSPDIDAETRKAAAKIIVGTVRTDMLRSGFYLKEVSTKEEDEAFAQLVDRGLLAANMLYDRYVDEGLDKIAWLMTINVLEQFPVKQWPAVARMVERDRSKNQNPESSSQE